MELHNFSLKEMAALIHDLYGYNIVMKQEELGDEQISGTILLKDEQTLLQTLSYALNIDIIKKNSTLIFEIKNKK
jgi:ferric-dicitrate binding protein FerR (iron transport regulator)